MDDFCVFLKNDRNFFLKQLHFIISLISFLFLILTNTVDSVIVALAIPGTVLNSALLLILYCLDERHDVTDIEILISYGILNLLAAMVFMNKTLQMDISIFRMLFLNSYTVNIILCLCNGLLMLGEGIHRLIVILVRNIYNNTQNSQYFNLLFNGKEPNSSINMSTIHKNNNSPDIDTGINTSPSVSNFKKLPGLSYAEKDTNTNTNPASLAIHPAMMSSAVHDYTDCSHYRLNSEHDKHRHVDRHNSGDNGYISEAVYAENDRRSGDGIHCNKGYVDHEKPFINEEPRPQVQNYFYPKSHVTRPVARHQKHFSGQNSSGFNEAGLPVFVDRYGKRYIASLAGTAENHRCNAASNRFDTSSGDCKKKASTPIDEYYTNRKYSNSKVTITPSKDEVNTNDGITADSKITRDNNINNNKTYHNHNNNINSTRIVNNEMNIHNLSKTKNKAANNSHDFITNYNNYLAQLYKNNISDNGKKLFNYKFYNHNYDYQWVCEA